KKGRLWLVTCDEDRQIRIRDLEKAVGAKSMSFARPELLAEALGVRPGAVTPFALLNDTAHRVRFVLDPGLEADALVNAHPLHNEATTAVSPAGLAAFLAETGHTPLRIDFDALEARARAAAQAAEETP
ncbi:MAG: YbaK/EbsC family protein, partial [Pseudomonadota bacterium]